MYVLILFIRKSLRFKVFYVIFSSFLITGLYLFQFCSYIIPLINKLCSSSQFR